MYRPGYSCKLTSVAKWPLQTSTTAECINTCQALNIGTQKLEVPVQLFGILTSLLTFADYRLHARTVTSNRSYSNT
jgi:hypothetical protein